MIILSTKKIKKSYGGVIAVDSLSLDFQGGRITSIIGPNGSGKSTLVNLITGFSEIDSGSLVVDPRKEIIEKIQKQESSFFGIIRTFQNGRLFNKMSVTDNIVIALTKRKPVLSLFEKQKDIYRQEAEEVLRVVDLINKKDELVENLSFGQKKLLEFARILAMTKCDLFKIKVILFDEPFSGVSKKMRGVMISIIKDLRKQGHAIILIEHNMKIIKDLTDYTYVLDAGNVLAQGDSIDDILKDKRVIDAYLGI